MEHHCSSQHFYELLEEYQALQKNRPDRLIGISPVTKSEGFDTCTIVFGGRLYPIILVNRDSKK